MQEHQGKTLPSDYYLFATPKKILDRHIIKGFRDLEVVLTRWLRIEDVECNKQGMKPLISRYEKCKCFICGEEYVEIVCKKTNKCSRK
jgi:hypothetical protein